MRRILALLLLGICLMSVPQGFAQTEKIQKEIDSALQKKKAEDESLAKLLAEALKNNPDIRVADAKLREAEAELYRARIRVLTEITGLQAEIQAGQAAVDEGTTRLERAKKLHRAGSLSEEELGSVVLTLLKLKGELAAKQAKLPYLLGRQTSGSSSDALDDLIRKKWLEPAKDAATSDDEFLRRVTLDLLGRLPNEEERREFMKLPAEQRRRRWIDVLLEIAAIQQQQRTAAARALEFIGKTQAMAATPLADKLRRALDTPLEFKADKITAGQLMDFVRDKLGGVNLQVRHKSPKKDITFNFSDRVPLGAFLQFVEEELECVFVLRDYGVVAVAADERLPPGAIRVVDFWKREKAALAKDTLPPEAKFPNPPAVEIRGTIEDVDPKDGNLVSINVGSDRGLKEGHTLDVYRTTPQPRFLGTVRIVHVKLQSSVGRLVPAGASAVVLQRGDQVTSQLTPDDIKAKK